MERVIGVRACLIFDPRDHTDARCVTTLSGLMTLSASLVAASPTPSARCLDGSDPANGRPVSDRREGLREQTPWRFGLR